MAITRHIIPPLTTADLEYCDHMDRRPYASLLQQFNAEIADGQHILHVLRDDGPYRHLKVINLVGNLRRFDIITWPKYLTIAGDRGSYTFAAGPEDMLPLFDRQVNPGYWAEKLTSMHPAHVRTFDDLRFRRWVIHDFWQHSRTLDQQQTTDWWEGLQSWLLSDWPIVSLLDEASVLDALRHVNAPAGHYRSVEAGMWDTNSFAFEYNLASILASVRAYRAGNLVCSVPDTVMA